MLLCNMIDLGREVGLFPSSGVLLVVAASHEYAARGEAGGFGHNCGTGLRAVPHMQWIRPHTTGRRALPAREPLARERSLGHVRLKRGGTKMDTRAQRYKDVALFPHENRSEGCNPETMDRSSAFDNVDVCADCIISREPSSYRGGRRWILSVTAS
ncbi:hypothetical protein BDK51DRAFT_51318 [Blyttiomyces helicus]|uniref:Uncharacterized protein n=1 Tax=Blyttiomyces helicus TaxID=388810 RepID=A0A4P9WEH4_9FUNG|nr:hypothetical protein BDK51DRAFT_51318 [Blyttiomyces helicus]|eukprot:RKO90994.1 hypothetical protein BDK51DRAFT_51318 [Blyttiomyces helicus]